MTNVIIRWLVILPTWCLFTSMFHFRTDFHIRTIHCLIAERTVFYTIRNDLIWSWRDRVTRFWCLRLLSSCRRWFLLAVLLPVTDVHISARSHSNGSLSSLYFGILETVHSWTWNVDLSWSDLLRCRLFLLRAACRIWCTGPEMTAFRFKIWFLINWSYLPFDSWYFVVT